MTKLWLKREESWIFQFLYYSAAILLAYSWYVMASSAAKDMQKWRWWFGFILLFISVIKNVFLQSLSPSITVLLRLTISNSMCGSLFRGLLEQQTMKETKQHYFYTPGSMSERAAGKLKKKKEERPEKCFWGTFLFSKCISSKRLPFSSFNQLLPLYPRNAVFISLHLDLSPPSSSLSPLRELVWSTAESRRTADLSVSISLFPPAFSSFFSELSRQQRE